MVSRGTERNNVELYGLILSGGKSTRMGQDKGQLDYHGLPQRRHMYELVANCCEKVFYSIREDQISIVEEQPYIVDKNKYQGPLNGILSAQEKHPDMGWLVLACDLPLLDLYSIRKLIKERDTSKLATAYATKQSNLPEPLVAIWEPKGLSCLKEDVLKGTIGGPRQFLKKNDIKIIHPEFDEVLHNANSFEEYQKAKTFLKRQLS